MLLLTECCSTWQTQCFAIHFNVLQQKSARMWCLTAKRGVVYFGKKKNIQQSHLSYGSFLCTPLHAGSSTRLWPVKMHTFRLSCSSRLLFQQFSNSIGLTKNDRLMIIIIIIILNECEPHSMLFWPLWWLHNARNLPCRGLAPLWIFHFYNLRPENIIQIP